MDIRTFLLWTSRTVAGCAVALLFSVVAQAQSVTIYDDALQNSFNDWSYGTPVGVDFANTSVVHGGTQSIAITGNASYNAISFEHASAFSTASYPVLHFYVNGGATSGQQIKLFVYDTDSNAVVSAPIDTYIAGGSIASGTWREVTVNLTEAPLSYNGNYVRFDLQAQGAQATVYFDDVTLTQASSPVVSAMQIEHDVTVSAMVSDRFTWQDSLGHPRVASLAHMIAPTSPAVNGSRGGALYEYRYQLTSGATRIADITTYPNAGYGGFGYVVSHSTNRPCATGDDSPLGFVFGGTWQRLFEGRHHAIFRFTQLYPRNCDGTAAPVQRFVPVTIDWVFSTGRDNPLWAITYDVDQIAAPGQPPVGPNVYNDDSRAPYGELEIDGDGSANINGVAWGDFYKFTTTNAAGTDATWNSPFDWTVANTVPYVQEWLDGALSAGKLDATIGIVQTQKITQQDAAGARDRSIGSDITPYWQKTQLDGVHSAGAHTLPDGDNWPYQAMGDNFFSDAGSNNARMTWKTQFGFIGQSTYLINNGANGASAATAPGYPKKSYSTYIVLGQRTLTPVEAQVTQVETIQSLTLSASTGSVVTSGPAGITRADNVTYQPAGYNHVYGALAFSASSNVLDANINVGAGTLKNPMIIVSNYTGGTPVVQLGGVTLTADADYFASVRTSPNELWITLNRSLSGATNHLQVNGGAPTAPGAPTIGTATPGNGQIIVSFTPPASDGGSAITSYTASCTPGPVTVSGAGSPITLGGLTNGTLYTCSVTATNAVGTSVPSGTVTATPVAAATAPNITNGPPPGGIFGTAYNFTFTANGSATITFSVTAGALPTGLSLSSAGVISGTPTAAGTFSGTITAANGTAPNATQDFLIAIAKANQTITFNNPGTQTFSTSPIALNASATSGLTVAFTSSTQGVCTVSGNSLTMVSAGTCTINADQSGSANYNAAATVSQSFAINATAPGAPTIGTATPGNGQAVITFTAPASNGGSAITSYKVTCTPGPVTASGAGSPVTVGGLTNGTPYSCSVAALNPVGAGASSGSVSVTPNATFAHGDVNGDGQINAADVFYLIRYLFASGSAPVGSADVNGDGVVNVADLFYLINYVFAGGPAPK